MRQDTSSPRLDSIDVRRQQVKLRSSHSNDPRITAAINRLISKFAHPKTRTQEKRLSNLIGKAPQQVEAILSSNVSGIEPLG
jgi:hypothetical protein